MWKQSDKVPDLEWPESYGPKDGREIVDAIVSLFHEACNMPLFTKHIMLIFVPDPPMSGESMDWIKDSLENPERLDILPFKWGKHGLAYRTQTQSHFKHLIATFLSMKSTTLSIIAMKANQNVSDGDSHMEVVITSFLANNTEEVSIEYAGLFFDMGVLLSWGHSIF